MNETEQGHTHCQHYELCTHTMFYDWASLEVIKLNRNKPQIYRFSSDADVTDILVRMKQTC